MGIVCMSANTDVVCAVRLCTHMCSDVLVEVSRQTHGTCDVLAPTKKRGVLLCARGNVGVDNLIY